MCFGRALVRRVVRNNFSFTEDNTDSGKLSACLSEGLPSPFVSKPKCAEIVRKVLVLSGVVGGCKIYLNFP